MHFISTCYDVNVSLSRAEVPKLLHPAPCAGGHLGVFVFGLLCLGCDDLASNDSFCGLLGSLGAL